MVVEVAGAVDKRWELPTPWPSEGESPVVDENDHAHKIKSVPV